MSKIKTVIKEKAMKRLLENTFCLSVDNVNKISKKLYTFEIVKLDGVKFYAIITKDTVEIKLNCPIDLFNMEIEFIIR